MPWIGMNWSSRKTTLITRPLSGWSMRLLRSKNAGESRSTNPTWFTTPAACTASTMCRASSTLVAKGFSQNTGSPRAATASTSLRCSEVHVHTYTASTRSSSSSSVPTTSAPLAAANVSAFRVSGSWTATIAASAFETCSILPW